MPMIRKASKQMIGILTTHVDKDSGAMKNMSCKAIIAQTVGFGGDGHDGRKPSRRKQSLVRIALGLLFWATVCGGSAQTIPALRVPPRIALFASFTDVKPDYVSFSDFAVYGFSMGGYLQTRHVIGAEVRGSITRWGGDQHQESALAGPRASLHFGHLSPYVALLGGGANTWAWSNPPKPGLPKPVASEEISPQWSILGGLDFHLKNRLSLRIGEVSYSHIYRKEQTLTPLSASVGIVLRIGWPSPRER
jgi:hypothetical protein